METEFMLQSAAIDMMRAATNLHSFAHRDVGIACPSFSEGLKSHPCTIAAEAAQELVETIRKVASCITSAPLDVEDLKLRIKRIQNPICKPSECLPQDSIEERLVKLIQLGLFQFNELGKILVLIVEKLTFRKRDPESDHEAFLMAFSADTHWDMLSMEDPVRLVSSAQYYFLQISEASIMLKYYVNGQIIPFRFLISST